MPISWSLRRNGRRVWDGNCHHVCDDVNCDYYLEYQPFLEYVSFILVIASLVQLVEMFLKKYVPELYQTLGIYLPLITTNCAVLGLALFMVLRDYNFVQSAIFGFGAGVGFTLALVIMAGIRGELEEEAIPKPFRGTGITLLTAGLLALAFMGFSGLVPV